MAVSKHIVLITCAGIGSRFNTKVPKQYIKINQVTILEHTINAFVKVAAIDEIAVIVNSHDNYIDHIEGLPDKVKVLKVGGDTRAQSVINGLKTLRCENSDWVLVHDAARCCVSPDNIEKMILQLCQDKVGGILAIPATDTIKNVKNKIIDKTLPREEVYLAQTPQMFRYGVLLDALEKANLDQVTDEASAVEQLGLPVHICLGDTRNIKITYPTDINLAQVILTSNLLVDK